MSFPTRWCAAVTVGVVLTACIEPLDTTRLTRPERSFGAEVYVELCKRVAANDPIAMRDPTETVAACEALSEPPRGSGARLMALYDERQRLQGAIDDLVPADLVPDLGGYLRDLLSLDDEGLLAPVADRVEDALGLVRDSNHALLALAHLASRQGYRPALADGGIVQTLLRFPHNAELIGSLSGALAPGGVAHGAFEDFAAALADDLRDLDPGPIDLEGTVANALLDEVPILSGGTSHWLARRDSRGWVTPTGTTRLAFGDEDGDGFADLNDNGQFVAPSGALLAPPTPFSTPRESPVMRDEHDRALDDAGNLVYDYRELGASPLAVVVEKIRATQEHESELMFVAPRFFDALLGGQGAAGQGWDLEAAPALDLLHALTSWLDAPVYYWALRLGEEALDHHEAEVAELALTFADASHWAGAPPFSDKFLIPGATLNDDLMQVFTEILRVPGLWEDLLTVLQLPESAALGDVFATFMRYSDPISYNPNDINGPVIGNFVTRVDRTQPDRKGNISVFQRILHLLSDSHGARLCNKQGAVLDLEFITYPLFGTFDECELFEVDNLALFYAQSIIGEAHLEFKDPVVAAVADIDELLEFMSGIDGFTTHPTPEAVERAVFAPRNTFLQNIFNPPLTKDGARLDERHPETLFALEHLGAFAKMQPLLRAFNTHGRMDLFLDVMSVLHSHWPSPQNNTTQAESPSLPAYSNKSGAVWFEELTAHVLGEGALGKAGAMLHALDPVSMEGTSGRAVLVDLPRQLFLPEWNTGLTTRAGRDYVYENDDTTMVRPLAPIWLLVDAIRGIDRAGRLVPDARDRLSAAFSQVNLVDPVRGSNGARFQDRRGLALIHHLMSHLRGALYDHWDVEDVSAWAASRVPSFEDDLRDPTWSNLVGLLIALENDPLARQSVAEFLSYMLGDDDAYPTTLVALGNLVQLLGSDLTLAPVLEALAPWVDPDNGTWDAIFAFAEPAWMRDRFNALPRVLEHLAMPRSDDSNELVVAALLDIALRLNRADPASDDALGPDDFMTFCDGTSDFITDDERGITRLLELLRDR